MIKPSRNLVIGGAVFLVAVAVLFAFTINAAVTKNQEPAPRPALSAASEGTLLKVAPLQYCDAEANPPSCDTPARPTRLAVEPGKAIVISLPDYITDRPWDVTIQRFDTTTGKASLETRTHVKPTEATLVLKSTDQLILGAVEIRVPSPVQDAFGNLVAQAVWGIDTLPDGLVANQKQ
ncbi:hypothetical protein TPAU25S_02309 [Tsukamurella paurometabola]|uniref:DUF2771 domain-containing protein n=1 Tax=Tsukamurella paurometabola (strain ATCC 8368 / DSM 20162 / CCUG 35730 / CIP 100753 / JCM 10117 / KCTC 9821 / NBRC 16120 / NCIMB 702349 / NCTC 13040) TaxID=521096 RepID=D5UTV9_TSUPD|nr:DUF2771 domain-containing protein [Tsukamurella paurometabola]ADG77463.1 hypothetical protein Tpau_0827 [Tsukamurella paurometabola DSM 20162]SUP27151.1 Protein of uncharacterised function (DUF2771) [Tsukamurella paurometabola]